MTEFSSPALEDLENTRDVAALLEAAKTGNLDEVIGQLDGVGTPVDSCVLRFGRTSLHWACEGGHENVCAKLISAQADVNFRDRSGATPLHWAAWNGHAAVCTLLIQHGADPTAQDNDSDTPLDGASDNACKEAIQAATSNMGNCTDCQCTDWSESWQQNEVRQRAPSTNSQYGCPSMSPRTPSKQWKEVRLHDMVEQLVEQNGRLMENQSLLVAEVKRLRGMLGQPVEDGDILEVEQEEY